MTTKKDLIIGRTILAFAEAETMSFKDHHETFERVLNLLKNKLQARHDLEQQNNQFDITATDNDK